MRVLAGAVVLLLAACGGASVTPSPTVSPQPLSVPELKYRVIGEVGRPWFCDRDFYPIARQDERELAQQRFPELQKDAQTFTAIVAHLGVAPPFSVDQQLAIYQEWKSLEALQLQRTGDVWGFAYLTQKASKSGEQVEGRVSAQGRVTVLSRSAAGPPNCPICLARGTRIATPSGEVRVEDLRVGSIVWTLDERGVRTAAPLVAVGSTPVPATHEVVRLSLEDGRVVLVSPGHPTADGRSVGDLVVGEALAGSRVSGTDRVPYLAGATFDVRPGGPTGTYWANGVLLGTTLSRAP